MSAYFLNLKNMLETKPSQADGLSRREALRGVAALFASATLPGTALASEIDRVREKLSLPDFETYKNPEFTRAEHEALHAAIEARFQFAQDPKLTRWNADPSRVYVNEKAGESIHITGVNLEENYAEMIWVLAPAYTNENGKQVVAHVPFEHEHTNQTEEFEKIQGEVSARVNGVVLDGEETDFFVAEPEDDHIGWNPGAEPLVMRVRYYPAFGQDGERALMTYWGLVDDPSRTKAHGQPADFALLGALNRHLKPQALASGMPKFLPEVADPFLVTPLNRGKVAALYRELTNEEYPSVS
jgi:hypothetical protein